MAIAFRCVSGAPLQDLDAEAPDGVVIGIIGENGSGKGRLLRLAAGVEKPAAGRVETSGAAKLFGPLDLFNHTSTDLRQAAVLAIDQSFAHADLLTRRLAQNLIEAQRRAGTTILLASHEDELLRQLADEIWWLKGGRLAARGDPTEILAAYHAYVAEQMRGVTEGVSAAIAPRVRRGDGRAEVLRVETIGENGRPTMVWRSGELAAVKVSVRFRERVADPVIGIMIRTRIGLNVYGTNTELEKLKLGPCAAGETIEITFAFRCELCPEHYTLTVASHDPDGVWHDWLEDAVGFSVEDRRYTAGVANLHATVSITGRSP
jgi:lipopolysaccharide transport system ATP-binding protein